MSFVIICFLNDLKELLTYSAFESNSEIRYLIANTYIKILILLLIREMKIIPYLGVPPGSFQYSECINVARRI